MTLITFLSLFIGSINSNAQTEQSIGILDVNNAKAYIPNNGALWQRSGGEGYLFPNTNDNSVDVTAIGSAGLWFGGYGNGENLKISATTYQSLGGYTINASGPLDSVTGLPFEEGVTNWNRHFEVYQSDIEDFLLDWSDGVLDNPIPSAIQGWPAKDNPMFFDIHGFDLPSTDQSLAPFKDQNGDGFYNPQDGDYPNTKGATKVIWWVFNNWSPILEISVQLEVQMMAYAYDSPVESINNSTFYDVKFINRASETLDSMFVSLWLDPNLGCYLDDYIGCNPEEGMVFMYNQDALDGGAGGCNCSGAPTYCDEVSIMGVKILKGPLAERLTNGNGSVSIPPMGVSGDTIVDVGLSSFIYYNSSSIGTPPPMTTDPNSGTEYYQYMNGRYRDNSPTLDENGEPTLYAYSGNPANAEEWSMCSENTGFGDRRALMNMGPLRLEPGASNEFTFCVTGVENVEHPCPDINILTDAMNEVQDLWEGNNIPVSTKPIVNSVELRVFPNPMKTTTQIALDDENDLIETIEIFNVNGQSVLLKSGLNDQNTTISRAKLGAGIYFYTISTKNQKIFSGRLMVQ